MAPLAILRLLYLQLGVRMLLHEGRPTLFGQFLAPQAVDELFMTLSPQIAGPQGGYNSTGARAWGGVYARLCILV